MSAERIAYVKALRDLANLLESESDIPVPFSQQFYHYTADKEAFKAGVRAIGSRGRKVMTDDQWANYVVEMGPLEYRLFIDRKTVCERKVIGTKQVEEKVVPAHLEEIVEWECEPWMEAK
jgi:hypothetical protein